jgi:hypothetical protein
LLLFLLTQNFVVLGRGIPVLSDRGESHRRLSASGRFLNDANSPPLVMSVRARFSLINKHIGDSHIGIKVVSFMVIV